MMERSLQAGGLPRWAIDRVLLCPLLEDRCSPRSEALLCGECGVVLLRTDNPGRDTAGALLVCTMCGALNVDRTTTGEIAPLHIGRSRSERHPAGALLKLLPVARSSRRAQPDVQRRDPPTRKGVVLPFRPPVKPGRIHHAPGGTAVLPRGTADARHARSDDEEGPLRPA